MTFGKWILVAGVLVTVAVVAIVIYMDNAPGPQGVERTVSNELALEFMAILPDSMRVEKRQEIEGLLFTFYARAGRGEVTIEDRIELDNKMRGFVDRGSIEGKELARLMAEVSHYSYRLDPTINPPDSSGLHPLLIDGDEDPR